MRLISTAVGESLGGRTSEKLEKQGFLKPAEWHDRAPFFCRLTKDVPEVDHPRDAGPLWFNHPFEKDRLQKAMDQAPSYAQATNNLIAHLEENFTGQALPSLPPCSSMQYAWPRALDHKTNQSLEK